MNDDERTLFHEGIDLFNDGEFFDAHEVWEDIWHMASGEKKLFYQGLIQCAVTLEHVRRGNPRGVQNVFASAMTKFVGLPDLYMGVNVAQLKENLRALIQPVLNLPRDAFDPGKGRGQALPVNLDDAPKITLAYDPFA